ncbi:MAG: hypothetical protein ACK5MK_05695 [Dysgonomonas sp.]
MNTFLRKFTLGLLVLSAFSFNSCSDDIAKQLREEVALMKSQCPSNQGNGVTLTDVNFYENEKIIEYIGSIEGVESLDATTVTNMKDAIVKSFSSSDVPAFGKLSVKIILDQYDYRFRYIYEDSYGNKLCKIDITKYDLK